MSESVEWDVVVVGGANTDYLVRSSRLPEPGETVHGDTFQEAAGGKGANQAVAAARLGARVALIACVGADERGDQLIETLLEEGVDARYICRDQTAETGVALVQVEHGGEKQIQVAPGANENLSVTHILAVTEAFAKTRVLLTQLEVPLTAVTAALRLAREAEAQIILDAAPPRSLPEEVLRLVDILRANSGEAAALTGNVVKDRASAHQAIDQLRQQGVKVAIVQAGSEGNLLVGPDGEQWLPLLAVDSVDTTGAGDAFVGALAVAVAENRPLPEAATFANVAAALTTTKIGAQAALPRRPELMAFIEQDKR